MDRMNFEDWLKSVPEDISRDSLWRMEAYRLALFGADLSWCDVTDLMRDRRTLDLSSQLYRAVGSIAANLAEGYSRGSGRDRARFYEYALGSAREARGWYYKARHILGEPVTRHRMQLTTQIIRLLLAMISDQREFPGFKEGPGAYGTHPGLVSSVEPSPQHRGSMAKEIPIP